MKKLSLSIFAIFIAVLVGGQNYSVNHQMLITNSKKSFTPSTYSKERIEGCYLFNKNYISNIQLKNADVIKQRLDSIVDKEKTEFFYNDQGFLTSIVGYFWENNKTVKGWKVEYTVDNKGNITQDAHFHWENNDWVNEFKSENTVDDFGNYTMQIQYEWVNNQWRNVFKFENSIDENGNVDEHIEYMWDANQWKNYWKSQLLYDVNNNIIQFTAFDYKNLQWVISWQEENTIDENGNIIQTLGKEMVQGVLKERHKVDYSYNNEFNNTLLIESFMVNDEWINDYKEESEFDLNGNEIKLLRYRWENNKWVNYSINVNVYDEFSNNLKYIAREITENLDTVNIWKTETVFDNEITSEELILPYVYFYEIPHKVLQTTEYQGNGDEWILDRISNYHYSDQTITDIYEFSSKDIVHVFPNPSSNQISFSMDASIEFFSIEFYDIQGRLILNQHAENGIPISIESLTDGLYFYRLTNDKNFKSGKFIVKR